MYIRIYNEHLIRVYTTEDLKDSTIIGKVKGRDPAGFTFRDTDNHLTFYDIKEISTKELQLIIRKSTTANIAILLSHDETIDYFYSVAKISLMEHDRELFEVEELTQFMKESIDVGIVKSDVWIESLSEVVERLIESGFKVKEE